MDYDILCLRNWLALERDRIQGDRNLKPMRQEAWFRRLKNVIEDMENSEYVGVFNWFVVYWDIREVQDMKPPLWLFRKLEYACLHALRMSGGWMTKIKLDNKSL